MCTKDLDSSIGVCKDYGGKSGTEVPIATITID